MSLDLKFGCGIQPQNHGGFWVHSLYGDYLGNAKKFM